MWLNVLLFLKIYSYKMVSHSYIPWTIRICWPWKLLLSIYSLVNLEKLGLIKNIMVELVKSIDTSITNHLRSDLARVRKS